MTISYQTQGGHTYATLCTVTRDGKKNNKIYRGALGRVIDRERHIFYNRERGLYMLDPITEDIQPAPDDVQPPKRKSRLKVAAQTVQLVFGDVYLIDRFARDSGFYKVLESAFADKLDAVKALICFYLLCPLSNQYAGQWLETSYAKYLFPKAGLTSSNVSKIFKYIGEPSRQRAFFTAYWQWFKNTYRKADIGNILIDSTGLPNSVHFRLTAISNHNGDINNEARIIYVVQQSTGMPIYFRSIPGNIIDVNTLHRTLLELKEQGIDTNYSITDAGYLSEDNVETLYELEISFLIRLQPNRTLYKDIVRTHIGTIQSEGTLVKQRERLIRVKRIQCRLNGKKDSSGKELKHGYPAYAYLCVDEQRSALERLKLIKKITEGTLDLHDYEQQQETLGVFILVSRRAIDEKDVVSFYYTRQEIEQAFDLSKNYTNMLPIAIHTEETFRGHMMLAFLSTIFVKALMQKFEQQKCTYKPTMQNLSMHSCSIYPKRIITGEPNALARRAYKAVGIDYPVTACIE